MIGIVDAVARTASRSFLRESRIVDNSDAAEGVDVPVGLVGKEAGGFLVASSEALLGRDVQAASMSFA